MTGEAATTEVRAAHRFDEAALERWLTGRLDDFVPPLTVRQFEGGQSNPTFMIEGGDGRRWVVRKKPPGVLLPSAHQVGREFRVIRALAGSGVPVAAARVHCVDESVIGTEFFVMDYVRGRILPDPLLPELSPAERGALYEDFLQTLARLHAVDPAAVGLSDYGPPANYYQRQIRRWVGQYEASATEDIPDMRRLMEWLPAHIPSDDQVTIAHGDFSVRNCMIHPTEPRILAVLDWELSTLGHPLADVAFATLFHMGETPAADIAALGIPSQQQMFDRYIALSGRAPVADWTFYKAFVLFRIAAINQGVYKRGLDGNAASEHFALAQPTIRRHAARAWSYVEASGEA